MLYIENNCKDPHYNLAFEEYVFRNVRPDEKILLLWQNEPSVIIGSYQNTAEEINEEYIRENGIHVVRRITGGGAVYHDLGNMNYSLIAPSEGLAFDFKRFTQPLVDTLRSLGVNAELSGRNDVLIDGMKFSGNAQHHSSGRVLHHGTIMFDSDLSHVADALKVRAAKFESKSVKSVRSRVTNILPHLPEPITLSEFKAAFLKHMDESEGLETYALPAEDLADIEKLRREKYDTWEWNFGRSPASNVVMTKKYDCGLVDYRMNIKHGIIEEMNITGDFFCSRDLGALCEAFRGIPYTYEAVAEVIEKSGAAEYFPGIDPSDIV